METKDFLNNAERFLPNASTVGQATSRAGNEGQVVTCSGTAGQANTCSSTAGQAIVEYILLLAIILSMTGLLLSAIGSTKDKMWKRLLCEVSAACPDCRSTESAKAAIPRAGVSCKN